MGEYEWLETFELRVPEIDGDHRAMFDLMTAVRHAANAGNKKSVAALLDRLLSFSRRHFQTEEEFLRRAGYEAVESHAEYHRMLLEDASNLAPVCSGTSTQLELTESCNQLMGFIIDDVVRGDIKLKSFLQEKGLVLA